MGDAEREGKVICGGSIQGTVLSLIQEKGSMQCENRCASPLRVHISAAVSDVDLSWNLAELEPVE